MDYRKIIHIDMDAFYASVEQRDDKSLRGKPIAVGMDVERGVVATASYQARTFGVHSAMSIQVAKRLCKDLIIVPPRFSVYKQVSQSIHEIFEKYTNIIEPISLDEAFLDVTKNKKGIELAMEVAKEIKKEIFTELFLTASAGVSYNKLLAKIASDYRKPNGLYVIHPSIAQRFIDDLPVERFWGVGPKTLEKMNGLGIFKGKDIKEKSLSYMKRNFGKAGLIYYDFARGIDNRPVITDYDRKSVGCEQTFEKDISTDSSVTIELYNLVLELCKRIKKTEFKGKTLTLKVKFYDFTQITRSATQIRALSNKERILPIAKSLMKNVDYKNKPIRLIGLSVSNPIEKHYETAYLF
ncbi:MAG: DNA polymerase IV [Bacteroidales bacterium]|nr:DNA polymerase IV [Bacteroidales bacterium]